MNDVINISIEKDNEISNINTDNSYTVIENILYCSSPKRGIKSKSNTKNKSDIAAPISSIDTQSAHFTFYIVKEASTDIGSKEDIIYSQKSSNLISEFCISNCKNSNFENNTKALFDKEEKEKEKEKIEKNFEEINEKNAKFENEEKEKNSNNKKYKSTNKKIKKEYKYKKYLSSILDENKINNKNNIINIEDKKNIEKRTKKKNYKYSSLESLEVQKNNNKNEVNKNKTKRFSSVNSINDKKKKKNNKIKFS